MSDLAAERQHLAKAERDIAEGEGRIARQVALVEQLRQGERGTAEAEVLLETLRQTLRTWQDHRDLILGTIARLEAAALDRPTSEAAADA